MAVIATKRGVNVKNGSDVFRYDSLQDVALSDKDAWFRLESVSASLTVAQRALIDSNRLAALEQMRQRLANIASSSRNLTAGQLIRISEKRREAMARRLAAHDALKEQANAHNERWRPYVGVRLVPSPLLALVPPVVLPLLIAPRHPRDARIAFREAEHIYILDGDQQFPISVSGVWARFVGHFKADSTIDEYFSKWATNPVSKYYEFIRQGRLGGRSDEELKTMTAELWARTGADACAAGTRLHRQIELFLNGTWDGDWPVEMNEFIVCLSAEIVPRGWRPLRTEWSTYLWGRSCIATRMHFFWSYMIVEFQRRVS
jgi:hypothetical protein